MKTNLREMKPLESKYYKAGKVRIPLRAVSATYGNPLYKIEFVRQKKIGKTQGRHYISELYLGLPHLENEGKMSWRRIDCHAEALDLGEDSRWNYVFFCEVHGNPMIQFYPPKNAKYLVLDISSSISIELEWVFEDKK